MRARVFVCFFWVCLFINLDVSSQTPTSPSWPCVRVWSRRMPHAHTVLAVAVPAVFCRFWLCAILAFFWSIRHYFLSKFVHYTRGFLGVRIFFLAVRTNFVLFPRALVIRAYFEQGLTRTPRPFLAGSIPCIHSLPP